jgi:hypothetical protein
MIFSELEDSLSREGNCTVAGITHFGALASDARETLGARPMKGAAEEQNSERFQPEADDYEGR